MVSECVVLGHIALVAAGLGWLVDFPGVMPSGRVFPWLETQTHKTVNEKNQRANQNLGH